MENEHDPVHDNLCKSINIVEVKNMVNFMEAAANCSGKQVEENSENVQTKASEVPPDNNSDCFVYRQDVVCCIKYEGLLGVVMEVAGDADSDGSLTSDSDSDIEDNGDRNIDDPGGKSGEGGDNNDIDADDEDDSLPDGKVRVVWTDGSETTDNISDITVVDRGFLHGDIISSATNPTGQLGLVVDVNITVDLLTAQGEVIKQITSKDLKRIREFTVGDYVVRGPWLGRVDDVLDNVTIQFDDGSICKVVKADPLRLQPVSKSVIDDGNCPYYPGQRIRAVSSSVFKSSNWLSGLWKANRLEGTVIKVQTASVVVYWIASAYLGVGTNSSTVPSEEQNPKDLTLLDCFSYANWQLGDWCLFSSTSNPDDVSNNSKLKEPIQSSHAGHADDRSISEELTDIIINPCLRSSGQDLHATDIVSKHHQSLEPHNNLTDIVEETECDSQGMQSLSGAISTVYDENASSRESKCDNLMDLDKTVKPSENNVAASNGSLPVGGSSRSSSVSKEVGHENWPSYRRKLRKVLFKRDKKGRRRDETFERALFVVKTVTKVDVAWQDGTKEYGLDSTCLIPIHTPNDHEFFPEQYVVEKASDEASDLSETKRVGIVRSLNAKEKTVCVRWLKPVSKPEDPREFDCEEVVSAYELDEHPDYDYCYGDVVVRLSPISTSATTSNFGESAVGHYKHPDMMESGVSSEGSNYENREQLPKNSPDEDFTCLTWVGNITGLQDGDIEVTWADGMVSKVGPQAIYVVDRDDDGDSFGGGSEVSDDGASWETVDENDMNTLVDSEKEADLSNNTDNVPDVENSNPSPQEDGNLGRNGALSVPLAALGFVTRFATGLFSLGRKQSDSDHLAVNGTESQETGEVSDMQNSGEELGHAILDALGFNPSEKEVETSDELGHLTATDDAEMTSGIDNDDSIPVEMDVNTTGVENHYSFKHFDIVQNPFDHYYLGSSAQSTGGKKWIRKIQQEWSILEKNLPDAIFVRVFEERMDLFRAVIIGAAGTPYQDGLFFFDFHLPPEYPQVPPHFEGFVKDHFQQRGYYILKACEAYMGDCMIGSLTRDACMTEKSKEHQCSVGFKLMLAKILPRLISAFKEVGVDCQQFEHLQKSEKLA
ncbi:uncharacterized protein A4U43_C07F25490 [Asparagus officinalis]|uniref:UBC core domain-containing protein n=1 Tax=Asparagus officinalis TaxID=4686 RepID=A0A5P1EF49_ASPOF|nr:uncharacterized protein A4U43_C07F25490 [Asparagus officinalis]